MLWALSLACLVGLSAGLTAALWLLRSRGMDRWIVAYARRAPARRAASRGRLVASGGKGENARPRETHVLLCVADHFEPQWGKAGPRQARDRVREWVEKYPELYGRVRDSDGRPPRHSFFFPIDEYDEGHVDAVAGLCRAGFGELEIHLHHDKDTADALRRRLTEFKALFARRHGMLARRRDTGELAYGFIHGNWALDNSRPDGCWCGVNNELDVLRETGCYADFTLPSAPSRTQTRKINSIYYATDDPRRPRSHDWGVDVGAGPAPRDALMLIQGPLVLDWGRRKWGLLPRLENANLQGNQPPTIERLDLWLKAAVRVVTRPDWLFVKLHTHGAPERNQQVLLGPAMVQFHQDLAQRAAVVPGFHYHYVTAREMYNLARAAEAGWGGTVDGARDFELEWNGAGTAPGCPRRPPPDALAAAGAPSAEGVRA